jgi:phage gp36-like protein
MYCTIENITKQISEETLIQLSDDHGAGVVDDDTVEQAITTADATIDAYCQQHYTIPISPVPARIADLSVDIAVYNLYSRSDLAMPEVRKDRYNAAIRFLEKVAEGKIQFGADTPAPADGNDSVEFTQQDRIFTRTKMEGY